MKEFRYRNGPSDFTMTVDELRAKLAEYPGDMPVFGQWEGCNGFIQPKYFRVEPVQKRGETFDALTIWVEDY